MSPSRSPSKSREELRVFEGFDLGTLRGRPDIAFYFRYPLHASEFHELREPPHGRLLGRFAAKPLYGRLTTEGKVDRSAGYNGRIAILFLPPRTRSIQRAELLFTRIRPERITQASGKRNWPAIRAAAERTIRRRLKRHV